MNRTHPALDVYIDAARDVHVLSLFTPPALAPWRNYFMPRGGWDDQVSGDVKARLIEHGYVSIQKHYVYLTEKGKEVTRYTEARG